MTDATLPAPTEPTAPARAGRWGHVRWAAIAALLIVGAVIGSTRWMRVCEDKVTDDGLVVKACRPAASTDVRYLVGLLAILVLMPGVSEMGIAGVITVKRRLSEVEKRTEEQAMRQDILAHQLSVTNLRLDSTVDASSRASAQATGDVTINSGVTPDAIRQIVQELVLNVRPPSPIRPIESEEARPESRSLALDFLRKWAGVSQDLAELQRDITKGSALNWKEHSADIMPVVNHLNARGTVAKVQNARALSRLILGGVDAEASQLESSIRDLSDVVEDLSVLRLALLPDDAG